jgi:subfamily B ATP-binding cassette protein MsbA
MTAGVLTVFLSYLTRFFKPVQELAKRTNAIAQTAVAVDRVQAILQTDEIIPERPNAPVPRSIRGEIVFDHVAFRYDKAPVLRDVSFRVEAGQFVGIVGPTGSGKSTIISLIPRFYDPTSGSIRIDGVDVRDYQLQGLRQNFAFVLQDTALSRNDPRKYRVWLSRCFRSRDRSCRPVRQRGRIHLPHARWLPHDGRRARHESLGRTTPAALESRGR